MQGLLEIRLLGPAVVRTATGEQVRPHQWKTAKNRDLLRVLAVNHGSVVPGEQLIEVLWPGASVDKGRTSLRTALAHVRRVVGADAVERVGNGLRLGPAWVDLAVYETKAAIAQRCFAQGEVAAGLQAAREAAALRTGVLLADEPFGDWAATARSHVELLHARLLATAAEAAADAGLIPVALQFGSMGLRHDPCAERPARVVMRACAARGEPAVALRVFSALRRALVEELGTEPSAETKALHLEVLAGVARPGGFGQSAGSLAVGAATPDTEAVDAEIVLSVRVERARGALQAEQQDVADLLALSEGPLGLDALLRLCRELDRDDVLRALAALDALGLLHTTSDGYAFTPGVAELAAGWIRPERSLALHARLAADERLPTRVRARHHFAAGDVETAAGLFLTAALEEARRGDPSTALPEMLGQARTSIERAGLDDDATATWLHRLADVAAVLQRPDEAVDALAAAARLRPDVGVAVVPALLADRPRRRPAPPAPRVPRPSPTGVELAGHVALRARLLVERVWPNRDLEGVRGLVDELELLVSGAVDPTTAAVSLLARAEGAVWAGDGQRYLHPLWQLWQREDGGPAALDPDLAARAGLLLGWVLHEQDDPRFAGVWDRAGDLARRSGRQRQWEALSVLAADERGDADRATDHAVLALATEPVERLEVPVVLMGVARHHQRHGRPGPAIRLLASALDTARAAGHLLFVPEIAARLAVLEAPRSLGDAATHLALAESVAGDGAWLGRERGWMLAARAALGQAAGDADRAVDLATRAEGAFSAARLVWELRALAELLPVPALEPGGDGGAAGAAPTGPLVAPAG